jgi:hypothetical protein
MSVLDESRASVTISRKAVEDARLAQGLTLQALADKSQLGLATIKRASGRTREYRCDRSTANALTKALDVDLDVICGVQSAEFIELDGVRTRISDLIPLDDTRYSKLILFNLRYMMRAGGPIRIDRSQVKFPVG